MPSVRARANTPDFAPPTADAALSLVADEQEWVRRIRGGDRAAFEVLFRAYYEPLCAFVAGYVKSDAVAEERVQEVLFRVWDHREEWAVRDGLRRYLFGAARNEALNALKRQRVEDRWRDLAVRDLRETGMGQGPAGPEDDIAANELVAAVDRVMARQPQRRREAFALRCRHHLTNPEIAAVMGMSVKGVEAAMRKVLRAIRDEPSIAG